MGLISNGGENLLDFLELRQVLSTYDGDISDPLWWPQERPVPLRVSRRPLGIPLPSMPGPKTLCGICQNLRIPLQSDMDLGYFWSLHRGVIFVSNGGMHVGFSPEH